jgi:hypothetical protein
MRPSTILVMAAITAATAVAAVVVAGDRRGAVDVARGERLFAGLGERVEQVRRIEVTRAGETVALVREGDRWVLPDRAGFPARADHVRRLIAAVAELETVEAKTRNPVLHDRLDLADPADKDAKAARVRLKDERGGVIADLLVGKRRPTPPGQALPTGLDMLYVRKDGDAQSWLVLGQIELKRDAMDWADREIVDLGPTRFARVVVERPDDQGFTLTRGEGDTREFRLDGLPEGAKLKSQFDVNGIGAFLESLTVDDVLKVPATLPAAAVTGRWEAADGLVVTARLVMVDAQPWLALAATGAGESADLARQLQGRFDGWLFKLPDWKRERLDSTRDALIEKPAAQG